MIRVSLTIELPGAEEFQVDLTPRWTTMRAVPAVAAGEQLDRAVADARTWLAARGAEAVPAGPKRFEKPAGCSCSWSTFTDTSPSTVGITRRDLQCSVHSAPTTLEEQQK